MTTFVAGPGGSLKRTGRPVTARIQGPSPQTAAPQEESPQEADPQETTTERLTRVSRRQDKFFIDPRRIPDGWSYEWKRVSVYGQPDPDHMLNLKANHWRSVPLSRHPEMAPGLPGLEDKGPFAGCICKDGQMLMERPLYLTLDAQNEDYEIAIDQVRRKERQVGEAPPGTFQRSGNPNLDRATGIRRSFRSPLTAEE